MITLTTKTDLKQIYEQDFNIWLEKTANLLKEGKFEELDLENLIEEIEDMGKNNKRELESRLIVLVMHLLKWKYQPQKKSKSWLKTINEQRIQLKILLKYNPSLKPFITTIIDECYQDARKNASKETNLSLMTFPVDNPLSIEQILDRDFFPESNS
jgi:hypothetical protein